jgi:hypothetical protein
MKKFLFVFIAFLPMVSIFGQVDVDHRRTVTLQTSFPILRGEEKLGGFAMFWFNENNFPYTNMATRIIFTGNYAETEMSYFIPASTNTAVGFGGGGGVNIDDMTPYVRGQRLNSQEYYGDGANGRIFVNQTIPNPTPLPLNVRATYAVSGSFYRSATDTKDFEIPSNFLTQSAVGELRFGGIEPGLVPKRGLELYIAGDQNWRSGFQSFGPTANNFPAHKTYQHIFASLSGRIPVKQLIIGARFGGGMGNNLDELSAWKLGGNMVNIEAYSQTMHGYYTREFFADDFGIANLALSHPISKTWDIKGHLYGDYAIVKSVPPDDGLWHNYFGTGAGVTFRPGWDLDVLVSYGYGFNAIRGDGHHGAHEIGLGLERQF